MKFQYLTRIARSSSGTPGVSVRQGATRFFSAASKTGGDGKAINATPAAASSSVSTADPLQQKTLIEADIVSGVPPEISRRSVRIYRPAKTAMQSGTNETEQWKIDFDSKDRWENPLMGWSSSGDPVQAVRIKFNTKEAAIAFAERQGYDYWVQEPNEGRFQVKSYSDNFKYVPGKLRIAKTK